MKYLTLNALLILGCVYSTNAQLLVDKNGVAHFFSEAPLEDIEATNEKALGAIDLEKGTVAVSMWIKDFHFDKSLMEEHFNENYMESEKYPKATFKGTVVGLEDIDFTKPGKISAKVDGTLKIHGVEKPLISDVTFDIEDDKIAAMVKFKVEVADHKVEIPRLVIQNIAEVVDVDAAFNFSK